MDNMPSLCSIDPGHSQYPEASVFGNLACHKYSSSIAYSVALAGNAQYQQNSTEHPVATTTISQGSILGNPDLVTSDIGEHAYNSWKDGKNGMFFMQTVGVSIDGSEELQDGDTQTSLQRQLGMLPGQSLSLQQFDVSAVPGQGLPLSLGTQIPVSSLQYQYTSSDISLLGPHQTISANGGSCRENGQATLAGAILNPKYLKVAQELLDEVVNVQKALKKNSDRNQSLHTSAANGTVKDGGADSKGEGTSSSNHQDSAINSSSEPSPSERQDLQNKVTKLLTMLDEVDRRYKHYRQQMQTVVSSFDAIAGPGAAKPYTTLALQTISQHFRCLRDAIGSQILVTRKALGEEDSSGSSKGGAMSRLRYIDQQLRQHRALQQFGMMQQHPWRPQRGLPESSVSVLRAWLFEHFLHPYPNDSEKLMLSRQTGLTRSQVSNWFINARVRLWKPMIEDMYEEEIGNTEIDSNSSSENPPKGQEQNTAAERCQTNQLSDSSKFHIIPAMDMAGAGAGVRHEASTEDNYMNIKMKTMREDSSFLQDALAHTRWDWEVHGL